MEGEKECRIGHGVKEDSIIKEENIMSLFPRHMYEVPEETERVARAIFPKGNLYMQWYDTFGVLFADEDFRALFAPDGQPRMVKTSRIVFVRCDPSDLR